MGQETGMFYVGLDVSVARTAVCIMDAADQAVREQSVASTPEAIAAAIRATGREGELVGLEAGINSAWIARGLLDAKLDRGKDSRHEFTHGRPRPGVRVATLAAARREAVRAAY